jgi:type IV pilus assembly protein PilB
MPTDELILEVLLKQSRVTQRQVSDAQERHPGAPVVNALLKTGAVQPRDIHGAIAHFHGLGFADLDDADTIQRARELRGLIPGEVARRHRILPLQQTDHGLHVAIADPTDYENIDTMICLSDTELQLLYADPERIDTLLADNYPVQADNYPLLADLYPRQAVRPALSAVPVYAMGLLGLALSVWVIAVLLSWI